MSSSIDVKIGRERAADAKREQDSADVIAERVACLDGLRVHVDVGQLMLSHFWASLIVKLSAVSVLSMK